MTERLLEFEFDQELFEILINQRVWFTMVSAANRGEETVRRMIQNLEGLRVKMPIEAF